MRIAIVIVALMCAGCGIGTPGNSAKIGNIIKVANEGIICKTWEATMIRGGVVDGTGAFGAPFDFTIEDKSLVPKVKEALDSGREVKIFYTSEGIYSACRGAGSGGHFLTNIEYVAERVK